MGVVYRATGPKLKREVAIKVLPEAFAADSDRLARFEREAQLLARLQHPCARRRMAGTGFRGSPFADADRPLGRG